jgi:hypothetical protein
LLHAYIATVYSYAVHAISARAKRCSGEHNNVCKKATNKTLQLGGTKTTQLRCNAAILQALQQTTAATNATQLK